MYVLIFDEFMQDKEKSPQIKKLSEYMDREMEELFGSSDVEDNEVEEKPELSPEKKLSNNSEPVVSLPELPDHAGLKDLEYYSRKKEELFPSHSSTLLSESDPKEQIGEKQQNLLNNPTKVQTNEEQVALLAEAIAAII